VRVGTQAREELLLEFTLLLQVVPDCLGIFRRICGRIIALVESRAMERDEKRSIASLRENQMGCCGLELNMPFPRQLKKAEGQTRLRIEPGELFQSGMTNVMLFCSQADLFPGRHLTNVLVFPGACQLT